MEATRRIFGTGCDCNGSGRFFVWLQRRHAREVLRAVARTTDDSVTRERAYRVWDEEYHLPLLAAALLIVLGLRRVRPPTGADGHDH